MFAAECAAKALETADAVKKLKLELFGVEKVPDKLKEFARVCFIDPEKETYYRILLETAIEYWRIDQKERAKEGFDLVADWIKTDALLKIKEK